MGRIYIFPSCNFDFTLNLKLAESMENPEMCSVQVIELSIYVDAVSFLFFLINAVFFMLRLICGFYSIHILFY